MTLVIPMVVWVSGCSCYETTGVITLLNDRGIVARDFRAGSRFCAGDYHWLRDLQDISAGCFPEKVEK